MNMAVVYSRACNGIEAPLVSVEVHLARGLPKLTIVGLPATAVKESKDRVRSAIVNSGFEFPLRRITVNLAPADLPKQGGRFDLPIALGILAASQQMDPLQLKYFECIGELALSGELRPVQGVLSFMMAAKSAQHHCLVPKENTTEATYVRHPNSFAAHHLLDVVAHFQQKKKLAAIDGASLMLKQQSLPDMADVQSQAQARRALEIAAAGGHHLLMIGPPGVGKSMLAERLPSLLPPLDDQHTLEVGAIHSVHHQGIGASQWGHPPFRSPHHSISTAALIGGGNPPMPGEISLAHRGVLFLDELPEFQRPAKEALREPLETGTIRIARAKHSLCFPARFQLIAAMNPCPCGYANEASQRCRCSPEQVERYRARVSGPLLDRIDITIHCQNFNHRFIIQPQPQESSADIRERVCHAHQLQIHRQGHRNASLSSKALLQHVLLNEDAQSICLQENSKPLSPRRMVRLLKVARSIADLDNSTQTQAKHLMEALTLNGFSTEPMEQTIP